MVNAHPDRTAYLRRSTPLRTLAWFLTLATFTLGATPDARRSHDHQPASADDFEAHNPFAPLSPGLLFPAPTPTMVVAGEYSCQLDQNATLSCQGPGVAIPRTSAPIATIAAGLRHICALDIRGALHCVGDRSHGQRDLPSGTYIDLAMGDRFSCALTSQSRVHCAGSHSQGPMRAPAGTYRQLVAAADHACALRTNGQIHCWGATHGDNLRPPDHTFVSLLRDEGSICARTARGTTHCWGDATSAP